MAQSKAFTSWPLVLDAETAQAGTAKYVNGTVVINPNLVTAVEKSAGDIYNTYAFLKSGDPICSFTTNDLKEFLDECGTTGMLIDSGASGDGVIIYYQKYAQ